MRTMNGAVAIVLLVTGCARFQHTSSLLLERRVRGSLTEEALAGQAVLWHLDPVTQTKTEQGIEVNVNYASRDYLKNFFSNRKTFGEFAGHSPYFPQNLVFYVKVANRSGKKIFINPASFVVTDDHNNQYHVLGQDYITAFAESRQPIATMTRGVLEEARPGYFGLSLPVGKIIATRPQGDFALLMQSALKTGPLFPDVVYDGLISFWNPRADAKKMQLIITGIKTDFDADDVPKTSLDFTFDFTTVGP